MEPLSLDGSDNGEGQRWTVIGNEIPERREVVYKDEGKGIAYSDNPEEEQSGGDCLFDSETWDLMILESLRSETTEKGAQSSKLIMGHPTEAEPESIVTTIHYKEQMLQKTGKSKENGKLAPGSTSSACETTNRGKPEKTRIQIPQPRANQQSEEEEIVGTQISMESFYASLEAETVTLLNPKDTQINTWPSEETQKAVQILRDFLSQKFSLLLQPKQSKLVKHILEYLLSLTPEDGISLRTRSVIFQISRSFTQWDLDYNDASFKLESASGEISKIEVLKERLEANVGEFREVEVLESGIWRQLDSLKDRKRELEKEINVVKAEIADFRAAREDVAKRKREVFENGRMLKAQRDGLRNTVPRLRAEEEWAKISQANIED